MVGVPKSTGCRNCRQRRVKCDEAKPFCQNCRKRKLQCPGYRSIQKFHRWLDEGPRLRRRFAEEISDPPLPGPSGEASSGALLALSASQTYIVRSPDLELNQMLYAFMESVVPQHQYQTFECARHSSFFLGKFIDAMFPLLDTVTLLKSATRALTLVFAGIATHNFTLSNVAKTHYVRALRQLRTDLQDPAKALSTETLAATVLLSFYEIYASSDLACWIKHAGGAAELFKLRGPAKHRHGLARDMWVAYKSNLITEAANLNRGCFLNEPGWRRLNDDIHRDIRSKGWFGRFNEVYDASKSIYEEFIRIPAWLRDARELRRLLEESREDPKVVVTNLIAQGRVLKNNLQFAFDAFSLTLAEKDIAPLSHPVQGSPFSKGITYVNIWVATAHMSTWTILMVMGLHLKALHSDSAARESYDSELEQAAISCCQSIDYLEKSTFHGPFVAFPALRRCQLVFRDRLRRQWLEERLLQMGRSRMAIAQQMEPFHHPDQGAPPMLESRLEVLRLAGMYSSW